MWKRLIYSYLFLLTVLIGSLQASAQKEVRHYDFTEPLGPEWVCLSDPDSVFFKPEDNYLRVGTSLYRLYEDHVPNIVGFERPDGGFSLSARFFFPDCYNQDNAGLVLFQSRRGYVALVMQDGRGGMQLRMHYQFRGWHMEKTVYTFDHHRSVYMRVSGDGEKYRFAYSPDGQQYVEADAIDCSLLTPAVSGLDGRAVIGFHGFQGGYKFMAGRNTFEVDDVEYQLY